EDQRDDEEDVIPPGCDVLESEEKEVAGQRTRAALHRLVCSGPVPIWEDSQGLLRPEQPRLLDRPAVLHHTRDESRFPRISRREVDPTEQILANGDLARGQRRKGIAKLIKGE